MSTMLAVAFAIHGIANLALSVLLSATNVGRWIIVVLASITAGRLALADKGRVVGATCIGILAFRLVLMRLDYGLSALTTGAWGVSYLVVLVVLLAAGKLSAPQERVAYVALGAAVTWTLVAYVRGIASLL